MPQGRPDRASVAKFSTASPTAAPFTHYWRIVATLANGRAEVFWGHARSLAEAKRKRTALDEAARQRGWRDHRFEIVELESSDTPPA